MSKSEQNDFSRVNILDEPDMIRKKFAKATTDSGSDIKYDPIKKPGISNLLNILSSVTGKSVKELEKAHEGKSYADFKNIVAEAVIKELSPLQDRFNKLSDKEVVGVLKNSSDKIAPRAQATLKRVKDTIGLGI
jgi:tryptophanyl-tRNA synthetase